MFQIAFIYVYNKDAKFGDQILTPSGSSGLLQGWQTPLTKHPNYLVFLHAVITFCNFLAKCIYGMKSIGAILTYVWKMPTKYWGMFPSLRGQLGLPQYT